MTRLFAALVVVVVAGCTAEDRRRSAPPAKSAPPALADATQHALAKELDDAERLGTHAEVKSRWQGQNVRWTVTRYRAFCAAADRCNVAAFAVQRPAKHGWLPTVQLAAGQFAALEQQCAKVDPCEVTIEGTLGKLELSDAMPTNVTITNATISDAPATKISAK